MTEPHESSGLFQGPIPKLRVRLLPRRGSGGLLSGMRVRKKLIVLHTAFSLALALLLVVVLSPAIGRVIERAEVQAAKLALAALAAGAEPASIGDAMIVEGTAAELSLPAEVAAQASSLAGVAIERPADADHGASAVMFLGRSAGGKYFEARASVAGVRDAERRLYVIVTIALLAAYAAIVLALEVLVLPQNVYGPIGRLLDADRAFREGRRQEELIPEGAIPLDELGEIMRSRNDSVRTTRAHERELAAALAKIEEAATDLKRKNHLLETARRNLADADRLASLGMMSAGIAHELNTPLAVAKGLVESIAAEPGKGVEASRAELLVRVVRRLERLSESLLDFARVRPPHRRPTSIAGVVDEAATLVRLERGVDEGAIASEVERAISIEADSERLVQVFVNLLRNAVDAVRAGSVRGEDGLFRGEPAVVVSASSVERDGRRWVSITVTDRGPGIDPEILPRLFEPFASTRLDSRGTGLGLAVAEGIVREHGGMILARNRGSGRAGSVFEVVLPASPGEAGVTGASGVTGVTGVTGASGVTGVTGVTGEEVGVNEQTKEAQA
ncbi:MAG: hypothetical protein JNL50_12710 [Phycisphaerae bacterium]|nr:hypothetical protein [Phycisphaerae bacterium]